MHIKINGKSFNFHPNITLKEILDELEIQQDRGIAVAVNQTVISRTRFHEVYVSEDDSVEIVNATAGG
ncbi:MAG: sulfur carrier protein ThiS [bacterium]